MRLIEAQHEGPVFFGKKKPWVVGFDSFKISPIFPHYNDYFSDITLGTRLHKVDLERFKEYFTQCDGTLEGFKRLIFSEDPEVPKQPEIYMRPYVEQILDLSSFKPTPIQDYPLSSQGRNMMQIRWAYVELSKLVSSPDTWLIFEHELQNMHLDELKLGIQFLEFDLEHQRQRAKELEDEAQSQRNWNEQVEAQTNELKEELKRRTKEMEDMKVQVSCAWRENLDYMSQLKTAENGIKATMTLLEEGERHQKLLLAEKHNAEQETLVLKHDVNQRHLENTGLAKQLQTISGIMKEAKERVFSHANLKTAILNCLTADHIGIDFGISPTLINSTILGLVLIILLIIIFFCTKINRGKIAGIEDGIEVTLTDQDEVETGAPTDTLLDIHVDELRIAQPSVSSSNCRAKPALFCQD